MTTRDRRVASATRQAVSYRNYRRARDRALTRLSQAYPETYKELLELEKVSDETTNVKWVDIDGNTIPVVGVRSGDEVEYSPLYYDYDEEDQSDDGGEA